MALRLDSRHLLLTYGTSAPAESLSRDPSHIRSQSLRGQPGCSTWLARYLRDHLRVEPPPPWARSGFRPLPAVCIGQDPRPAPSALRTPAPPRPRGPATGSRGAGPRAAASPRRGGARQGAGLPRCGPISAAITSMQIRAQWSEPITRPCKQA